MGKKATQDPKFLSITLLITGAQPFALNTACASSAALKGRCPPWPLLSPNSSMLHQWTVDSSEHYRLQTF